MSAETELPWDPFETIVGDELTTWNEGERTTAVGLITFDHGRKLILIGNSGFSHIESFQIDTYQFPDLSRIDCNGRLINMNDFDEVEVTEVAPADVTPMPDYKPDFDTLVNFKFDLPPDDDGRPKDKVVEEEEMVATLMGRQGGIVLFENQGLPELPALVVEEKDPGIKKGLVLFF